MERLDLTWKRLLLIWWAFSWRWWVGFWMWSRIRDVTAQHPEIGISPMAMQIIVFCGTCLIVLVSLKLAIEANYRHFTIELVKRREED